MLLHVCTQPKKRKQENLCMLIRFTYTVTACRQSAEKETTHFSMQYALSYWYDKTKTLCIITISRLR